MRTIDRLGWGGVALASLCFLMQSPDVSAGDHQEAPAVVDDPAADIADLYAWATDDGRLVLILTWAGYGIAGDPPVYDADVLYTFNIDTNADNTADVQIHARFGQDASGNWGVQVLNIPGTSGPIEGEVETVHEAENAKVWAGLRDDPFFFDKEGYTMTLSTGDLSFDNSRDFALLQNCTALAVELPVAEVASGPFSVWATTGRK